MQGRDACISDLISLTFSQKSHIKSKLSNRVIWIQKIREAGEWGKGTVRREANEYFCKITANALNQQTVVCRESSPIAFNGFR